MDMSGVGSGLNLLIHLLIACVCTGLLIGFLVYMPVKWKEYLNIPWNITARGYLLIALTLILTIMLFLEPITIHW